MQSSKTVGVNLVKQKHDWSEDMYQPNLGTGYLQTVPPTNNESSRPVEHYCSLDYHNHESTTSSQWRQQQHTGGELKKKARRIRTNYSRSQLTAMQDVFKTRQYLSLSERAALADQIGIAQTQVKVWFQNARSKFRKSHREMTDDDDYCRLCDGECVVRRQFDETECEEAEEGLDVRVCNSRPIVPWDYQVQAGNESREEVKVKEDKFSHIVQSESEAKREEANLNMDGKLGTYLVKSESFIVNFASEQDLAFKPDTDFETENFQLNQADFSNLFYQSDPVVDHRSDGQTNPSQYCRSASPPLFINPLARLMFGQGPKRGENRDVDDVVNLSTVKPECCATDYVSSWLS